VKSNIYLKELELDAAQFVIDQINPKNVVRPQMKYISKEDVMLWNDYIFIGTYKGDYKDYITARTNLEGVQFIKTCF
jgi:hypothetical protein